MGMATILYSDNKSVPFFNVTPAREVSIIYANLMG
jgi:hypothetical protein